MSYSLLILKKQRLFFAGKPVRAARAGRDSLPRDGSRRTDLGLSPLSCPRYESERTDLGASPPFLPRYESGRIDLDASPFSCSGMRAGGQTLIRPLVSCSGYGSRKTDLGPPPLSAQV